ncbi:MAG: hypothetical protein GYB40_15105 [Vibrionaceae bacterium]|nr:hypothetical protein [Vibrionaceae bacterium]
MSGTFCISLDYELIWGMHDCITEDYLVNISKANEAAKAIFDKLNKFDVKCTWAIVGLAALKGNEELLNVMSSGVKFNYFDEELNSISRIESLSNMKSCFLRFDKLFDCICEHKNHEVASHTFSHLYLLETSSPVKDFKVDHDLFSSNLSLSEGLKSVVFPRNQYTNEVINSLSDMGYTHFRGNQRNWIYKPRSGEQTSFILRVFRYLDSFVNISGHNSYSHDELVSEHRVKNVPASFFLRPSVNSVVDYFMLKRIKKSMTYSARNNKVFHLWWHPHNFGKNLESNLRNLNSILVHYIYLKEKYNYKTLQMKEL